MLDLVWFEWLAIGTVAGALAARLMRFDPVRSLVLDIVISAVFGLLGAALAGGLLELFGAEPEKFGLLNTALAATFGAALLIWLARELAASVRRRRPDAMRRRHRRSDRN